MLKECIKTAPTIDEARAAALIELGLSEMDNFSVEVLQAPVKKTLGLFGGKPAQVKITVEVPDEVKPEKAQPVKENKPKKQPKPEKAENKAEKVTTAEKIVTVISTEEKKASLKPTNEFDAAAEYLKNIILGLGMENCEVKTFADDEDILFEVECGDDYGIVIGRRGETLDAIQYLVRMIANKGTSGYKRVSVNIGDYRDKRAAVLVSLAKKNALRAVRTGRNVTLEPMNPYERRIIHTAVQDIKGATSYSIGADLDRRVIIAPENAPKSNYNRRDRGDRGRRPKREPYIPEVSENREKKSDYSGASLYGKIEVKKNDEE